MAKKKKVRAKKITTSTLVARTTTASRPANIGVSFFNGIGQVTASLFRNGVLINMQSISTDGTIRFADVQSGDTMSVNGVCTGTATIRVNLTTHPQTPENFGTGVIMTGYLFL
jgi:hypothetical protein